MSKLGELLYEIELPDAGEACERTAASLAATYGTESETRTAGRRRKGAWVFAVAVSLLVGFLALTPSGRSAVSWAAELIGIGKVGGPPTLDQRPDTMAPTGNQVVIGNGRDPTGNPFEVVAYTAASPHSETPDTCVFADFPGRSPAGGKASAGVCLDGGESDGPVQVVSTSFPADGPAYVTGVALPGAEQVNVRIGAREPPARTFALSGSLQQQAGAAKPLTVFVGFLPRELTAAPGGPPLEVTAHRADGTELGHDVAGGAEPGRAPTRAVELCRDVLEQQPDHAACQALLESASDN